MQWKKTAILRDGSTPYTEYTFNFNCESDRDIFAEYASMARGTPFILTKVSEGVSKKDGKYTTVFFWDDGTKTVVRNMAEDKPDRYMAFCAAYVKKYFGTTHRAQKMCKDAFAEFDKLCEEKSKKAVRKAVENAEQE